jgi:hypothetical protein
VQRWLQKAAESVDAHALTVDARVRVDADQWVLELVLESSTGRAAETLRASHCETLVEVVGLKVSLAAAALRAAPVNTPAAPVLSALPARSRPPQASVRATAGMLFGPLPELGPAFALATSLRWPASRLELLASYAPPQAARYASPLGLGADFQLVSGAVRVCWGPTFAAVELPICVGLTLGAVIGSGFGAQQQHFSRADLYGSVDAGPALRWPLLQAMAAWFELCGSLAFARPEFHTRGLPLLFQPQIVALRVLAGLELTF